MASGGFVAGDVGDAAGDDGGDDCDEEAQETRTCYEYGETTLCQGHREGGLTRKNRGLKQYQHL